MAALTVGAVFWLCGCGAATATRRSLTDTAMGTVVSQTLYIQQGVGEGEAQEETASIMELLTELEQQELSWRISGSEVAQINAQALTITREDVNSTQLYKTPVSASLYESLVQIWQVSKDSGGALDVTLGRLSRLWNLDELAGNGEMAAADKELGQMEGDEGAADRIGIPTAEQIRVALEDCGFDRVQLSDGAISLPAGMQLDLGAVGKGIACDRVREYLRGQPQIVGAVVAVGGSVVTYGQKPDGSSWKVAIMHPREEGSYLGILSLTGEQCVSTSGDYERYVVVDGERYHHILDPSSGYPARNGLCSVTIVCDSGLLADALSTACFVLGPEQGLALARDYVAEALLVEEDGSLYMTEGMKRIYEAY
ncbi:MAG: FAD:protein FMN transferase [Muribaculum sp.]|nr:FAD:protein FMN transferase [Muribaculum sp.]